MAPATSQEMTLHHRLLEGDEVASAEAFDRYFDELAEHLICHYPRIARHYDTLIDEAVSDALFDYIDCPEKYDPEKMCLGGYLRMAAAGDLLNRWRKVPRPEKAGKVASFEAIRENEFDAANGDLCYLAGFDIDAGLAAAVCRAWQVVLSHLPRASSDEIVRFLDDFVELGVKSGSQLTTTKGGGLNQCT